MQPLSLYYLKKSRAKVRKIAELRHPARCELGFWGDDMADCCGCGAGCVGCGSVSMLFRCCRAEISDRGTPTLGVRVVEKAAEGAGPRDTKPPKCTDTMFRRGAGKGVRSGKC